MALLIHHDRAERRTGQFQTDGSIEFPEKSVAGERIDVPVNVGEDGLFVDWWYRFCGVIVFSLTRGIGMNSAYPQPGKWSVKGKRDWHYRGCGFDQELVHLVRTFSQAVAPEVGSCRRQPSDIR